MSWPITWPDSANINNVDPAVKTLCELYAGACMTALTLHRVGGTPVTIIPGSLPRIGGWYGYWDLGSAFIPGLVYPSAHDLKRFSDYFRTEALQLPGPIAAITEIRVGGAVLPETSYQVENGIYLIRTDGEDWPADHSGGFTVTYLNSYPVDAMGAHAGGIMAAEWLKLISGDKKCKLPSSTTTVSRQGLTIELVRGMFPDGVTGMPEIDAYLMLFNPFGLKVAPRVYSPDLPRHRQVTG